MKNELISINVYIKPFIAIGVTRCLFDICGPINQDMEDLSLSFYQAIERYPLHKYKWNTLYAEQYLSCEFDKSNNNKQLCKLLTRE